MPVIPVNRVVDMKSIIGKNGGPKRRTPPPQKTLKDLNVKKCRSLVKAT
jgi:hypothetical protein